MALAEEPADWCRTLCAPVCRHPSRGREFSATSKIGSAPPRDRVGDPIALVLNRMKPDDSDAADGSSPIFTCGMSATGVLLLAVGLITACLALSGQVRWE
ncbi:MAG: hypothetical protein ACM3O7_11235 [Acidobacteriota bacterium]